jgi:hypothetical protein
LQQEARPEDLVIIEDADEFVKPSVVQLLKHCEGSAPRHAPTPRTHARTRGRYDNHLGTFARMFQSTLYRETLMEWSGTAIVPRHALGAAPYAPRAHIVPGLAIDSIATSPRRAGTRHR